MWVGLSVTDDLRRGIDVYLQCVVMTKMSERRWSSKKGKKEYVAFCNCRLLKIIIYCFLVMFVYNIRTRIDHFLYHMRLYIIKIDLNTKLWLYPFIKIQKYLSTYSDSVFFLIIQRETNFQ